MILSQAPHFSEENTDLEYKNMLIGLQGPVWELGYICPSQHLISGGKGVNLGKIRVFSENLRALKESSIHLCRLRMCEGYFPFLPSDSWADPARYHDPSLSLQICKIFDL